MRISFGLSNRLRLTICSKLRFLLILSMKVWLLLFGDVVLGVVGVGRFCCMFGDYCGEFPLLDVAGWCIVMGCGATLIARMGGGDGCKVGFVIC